MNPEFNPYKFLTTLFAIFIVSIFLALFIRGVIAKSEGVFYYEDIVKKLPPDIQDQIKEQEFILSKKKYSIEHLNKTIDSLILLNSDESRIQILINIHEKLSESVKNYKSKLKILPYYLGDNMFLWPWLYFCFGIIIFLLHPPNISFKVVLKHIIKILTITFLLFICYRWPTYARNFILNSKGQTVFAAANFNISPIYFFTQEVIIFILFFLLSIIMQQYILFYNNLRNELRLIKQNDKNIIHSVLDSSNIKKLSEVYINWQITSLMLALGFIFYSETFWQFVIQYNDMRYLPSAVIIHCIWIIIWIIISMPLLLVWHEWHVLKVDCKKNLLSNTIYIKDKELIYQMIESQQPIPLFNITITSITAVISFILPIIKSI